jgi:ribosomal protein S18 acetylase RimI-like enzyme
VPSELPADVRIDPADSDDAVDLTDLWTDLADGQRRYGSHLLAERNHSAIRETMLRHIVADSALLARQDGSAVGFVTFDLETEGYKRDVSRGIVHNIYVRESHRNQGIGRELLAEAEAELDSRGADVVSLQAMARNGAARRFYRRHGYEPHRIELEKPINTDTQSSNGG